MTEPAGSTDLPAPRPDPRPATSGTRSQTLGRGIRVLEILHSAQRPMTVADLAGALGVHRSIVYRILRTLEDHRLVARSGAGSYELGLGLPVLARGVAPDLQTAALPVLSLLANDTGMTAFLTVPSQEEAVTLLTIEPRRSVAHITYAPGARHPLEQGAPGVALLSAAPPRPGERAQVAQTRERGWAHSRGEVIAGLSSVAAPLRSAVATAAIAVVYLESTGPEDPEELGLRVRAAAKEILANLP